MEVPGKFGLVEVVKLEDWKSGDGSRSGRNVHFRDANGGTVMQLPLSHKVNGDAPKPGAKGELLVECYPWHDAALSRAGKPFPVIRTKVRVTGFRAAA
jgi:hypothetical protein